MKTWRPALYVLLLLLVAAPGTAAGAETPPGETVNSR